MCDLAFRRSVAQKGRPAHAAKKPSGSGVPDHMAFRRQNTPGYIAKLKSRTAHYNLRRLPENGPAPV
jgi:hypothetical protein